MLLLLKFILRIRDRIIVNKLYSLTQNLLTDTKGMSKSLRGYNRFEGTSCLFVHLFVYLLVFDNLDFLPFRKLKLKLLQKLVVSKAKLSFL